MTEQTTVQPAFTWLTVPPYSWPIRISSMDQTCGVCNLEMNGTQITSVRGYWEHYRCAKNAFDYVMNHTWQQGRQRDMVEAIQERPLERVAVVFDPSRPRDQRYFWETS